jgi:hypothetical protein
MKQSSVARFFSVGLATIYFVTQVAFAHAAEANFWDERRQSAKESAPVQVAWLPEMNMAINTLPRVKAIATLPTPSSPKSTLPSIPNKMGKIIEVAAGQNAGEKPVIILQDVHGHAEAQANLSALIASMQIESEKELTIGVEGAIGAFDFTPYRGFTNKRLVRTIADFFLQQNQLSAPSHAGITLSDPLPSFVGVEDEALYDRNIKAAQAGAKEAASERKRLLKEDRRLRVARNKTFNPALRSFDAARDSYHAGKMPMADYIAALRALAPGKNRMFESLNTFVSAAEMERAMDLPRVERERNAVLMRLAGKLSRPEINRLALKSLSLQAGRTDFAAFHADLAALIEDKGISLAETPAFDAYLKYVAMAESIKAGDLIRDLSGLERTMEETLAISDEERALLAATEKNYLAQKLVDLSLTPDEWARYQVSARGDHSLRVFEDFYSIADARSRRMVDALGKDMSVLIVGGFHTPLLTRELTHRGRGYAVVQPRITRVDNAAGLEELSIFSHEKTPLEKMFEGQKLFLAPPQRLVGSTRPEANASAARMIVSEMLLSGETPVSSRLTRTDAGNDVVRFQSAAGATVLATTRERLISKFRSLESWHIPGAGFVQIVAQRMTPLENMGLFMRSVVVPLAEAWFPILTIALGPTLPVLAMNAFVFALIHRKHIAPRTAGAFIILALSSQLASPGWVFLGTTVVLHGVWNAVVPREWRLQIIEKPEVKSLVKETQHEKIAELVTKQIQENRSH